MNEIKRVEFIDWLKKFQMALLRHCHKNLAIGGQAIDQFASYMKSLKHK